MDDIPSIAPFRKRFEEIDAQMQDPAVFQDLKKSVELSREHQKLSRLLKAYDKLQKLGEAVQEYEQILNDAEADEDLKELAGEEFPALQEQFAQARQEVLIAMIPPEACDSRNTVMEIRAGAGGDEASLFAADLFRMYNRYTEERGWKIETLGANASEAGGFKEIVFLISGEEVFKRLKYESGVHRVQRVPVTETNGRLHTSTITVAVLPEAEEVDVRIDPKDLEITVCRASGPGGQCVNTTDSAVQMLHKPSGLVVQCADERSQLKNKNKALKVLRARLLKQKQEEEQQKYSENRRKQVGSGDRSERIRTYNFPQSRVTDHRIGLTLHSLPAVLDGSMDEVINALQQAEIEEKLKEVAAGGAADTDP